MKILMKVSIAVICLIALVYFGQAQKANRVQEYRIKARYDKGEISQQEYDRLKEQNTLLKTLFNPKEVLNVD